jgi:hypothetical protein
MLTRIGANIIKSASLRLLQESALQISTLQFSPLESDFKNTMNANPNKSATQHQPIFIGNTKTDISNKKLPVNMPKRNLVGNELNFSNPGAN